MKLWLLVSVLLCGCPAEPEWSIPVSEGPGGMMLTAWSDGDELLFGGGDLDGSAGRLIRATGDSWCVEELADRPIWWIHGDGAGAFTAVGEAGLILRSEHGVVTDESVPTTGTLFGAWHDGDRVWAVGGDATLGGGEIWLREGGVWTLFDDQLPGTVFKVWDDWFVGSGFAMRMEEGVLVDHSPSAAPRLLTVRGRAADDVWAVGGDASPILLHWDGTEWTDVAVDPVCASGGLNGVWTDPGQDVWIAGMSGAMARWDGTDWHCSELPLTFDHFHAAWMHQGEAWFAGGDFFQRGDNHATLGNFGVAATPAEMPACP